MTTIEKDKKDTFDHTLEKKKQEYWNELDLTVHPSKRKGLIVTQEGWERRQKEAKTEQKQNPLLYYSNIIHGWVPDDEKSIEDMQEGYDANERIRGERIEKRREEDYLRNLLKKTIKSKEQLAIEREKAIEKAKKRGLRVEVFFPELSKEVDNREAWQREVGEEFHKKCEAERDAKYGKGITKGEGITKTRRIKEIKKLIKALVDEREIDRPVFKKSPKEMLLMAIEQIDCECETDSICKPCNTTTYNLENVSNTLAGATISVADY